MIIPHSRHPCGFWSHSHQPSWSTTSPYLWWFKPHKSLTFLRVTRWAQLFVNAKLVQISPISLRFMGSYIYSFLGMKYTNLWLGVRKFAAAAHVFSSSGSKPPGSADWTRDGKGRCKHATCTMVETWVVHKRCKRHNIGTQLGCRWFAMEIWDLAVFTELIFFGESINPSGVGKCPLWWLVSIGDEISPIYSWVMWLPLGHQSQPLWRLDIG